MPWSLVSWRRRRPECDRTVARLLLDMRRSKDILYNWIVDNTRWMRKPRTFSGLTDFVDRSQKLYRRSLWDESDLYVEVWCEKEALAGVLFDVTEEYDVPLMISRGFVSESYLYTAADAITDRLAGRAGAEQAVIYYFGDHDPSELKISESIESGLRRLCSHFLNGFNNEDLFFERVAVTEVQIKDLELPTRPTKLVGNKHAVGWAEEAPSVELDAIPPGDLRALAQEMH